MSKTLYYHSAPWCQPCKRLKPMAKRISAEMGARFVEINVDEGPPVIADIYSVPTVVVKIDETGSTHAIFTPDMVNAATIRKALA